MWIPIEDGVRVSMGTAMQKNKTLPPLFADPSCAPVLMEAFTPAAFAAFARVRTTLPSMIDLITERAPVVSPAGHAELCITDVLYVCVYTTTTVSTGDTFCWSNSCSTIHPPHPRSTPECCAGVCLCGWAYAHTHPVFRVVDGTEQRSGRTICPPGPREPLGPPGRMFALPSGRRAGAAHPPFGRHPMVVWGVRLRLLGTTDCNQTRPSPVRV